MGSRKGRSKEIIASMREAHKTALLWSPHETQLFGEKRHPKDSAMK